MKVVTKDGWFDGAKMWKKGEVYTGNAKKGHFKVVEGEEKEDIKEMPLRLAIKKALQSLDHEDNKQWTNAGLPQVKVVEKIVGQPLSRDQITDVYPSFKRDVKPLSKEKTLSP